MLKKPDFSIIIPAYNYAHFLPVTLASVLAQQIEPEDLEIVIVDDGSTDDTRKVVKTFAHPSIKYIYQKNAGHSAARNTGLQHANGAYVVFLDADDLLAPGYLDSQRTWLKQNPGTDIAVSLNERIFTLYPHKYFFSLGPWRMRKQHLELHLFYLNISPPSAFCIRRACLPDAIRFDSSLPACEDYDFWLQCLMSGVSFGCNQNAMVLYRIHPGSVSRNLQQLIACDYIILKRIDDWLKKTTDAQDVGLLYGRHLAHLCANLYIISKGVVYNPETAKLCAREMLPSIAGNALSRDAPDPADSPFAWDISHYVKEVSKFARVLSGKSTRKLLGETTFDLIASLPKLLQAHQAKSIAGGSIFVEQKKSGFIPLGKMAKNIDSFNCINRTTTDSDSGLLRNLWLTARYVLKIIRLKVNLAVRSRNLFG